MEQVAPGLFFGDLRPSTMLANLGKRPSAAAFAAGKAVRSGAIVSPAVVVRTAGALTSRSFSEGPGDLVRPGQPLQTPANPQQTQPPVNDPWVAVQDKNTGGWYYWNQITNETTMVGEPKPTGMYRQGPPQEMQPQTFGQAMGGMFLWGAGITVGFAVVGAVGRMLFG